MCVTSMLYSMNETFIVRKWNEKEKDKEEELKRRGRGKEIWSSGNPWHFPPRQFDSFSV